jgi:AcrR family transcriptional regulator
MNGYKKRTEQKKASILKSARVLFNQNGIDETKIIEIAKIAEVSPVSIYNYFNSKEGLLRALIEEELDKSIQMYNDILDSNMPFEKKLDNIMNLKNYHLTKNNNIFFTAKTGDSKRINKIYEDIMNYKGKKVYMHFIKVGKNEGYINENIDNQALLDFMMQSFQIMSQDSYKSNSADYKKDLLSLFLYGILDYKK